MMTKPHNLVHKVYDHEYSLHAAHIKAQELII